MLFLTAKQQQEVLRRLLGLAEGRAGWPGFLAAEVTRAAGITDPFERSQLLVALAQAANVDHLVSGVKDLTSLATVSPPVLSPATFLDLL